MDDFTTRRNMILRFPGTSVVEIRAADFAMILDGVDLASVQRQERHRLTTDRPIAS